MLMCYLKREGVFKSVRTISSAHTFEDKVVKPAILILFFCFAGWRFWAYTRYGASYPWGFTAILIAAVVFILKIFGGLKRVRIDATHLYVSNYVKEVSIRFSLIADVTENRWMYRPVTIHFRSDTEFGQKITFMPTSRFFAFPHPIVAELKQLAGGGAN
jgi:hypothetical protein